jgi:hypothetical protein
MADDKIAIYSPTTGRKRTVSPRQFDRIYKPNGWTKTPKNKPASSDKK